MSVRLLVGDCRAMLATLPERSVHAVCTSPPYHGLRAYGTAPQVWGEPEGGCPGHEWETRERAWDNRRALALATNGEDSLGGSATNFRRVSHSDTCLHCGAWRGELGSEPDPWQFVADLVEVFQAVKRVLRDDGTCWVNLGMSYSGSGKGPTGHNGIQNAEARQGFTGDGSRRPARGIRSGSGYELRDSPRAPGFPAKCLIPTPWMFALAMIADGWILRSAITWCLSGGTMLYARTQKGDMPQTVKDLARLDPATVQLWNGERWTRVVAWRPNPLPNDPLEIELRTGERIGCTPEHEWPTQRGLVPASELRVGDVLTITRLPEPESAKRPSALNDADMGWIVGMYLAEGWQDKKAVYISSHVKEIGRFERCRVIAESFHGSANWQPQVGSAAVIRMYGRILHAVLDTYIAGDSAKTKRLTNACWERSDVFLRALLEGYLEGDGHWDAGNRRWRLGFTRNYALEGNLRTLCARLGITLRLREGFVSLKGKRFPVHRGEIRFDRSDHHANRRDGEIVGIGYSRGRKFWDIEVEDAPNTFALASGVLTHNCKKSPMPESVTDRPTSATELILLFSKRPTYFYDAEAVREPAEYGRRSAFRSDRYTNGRSFENSGAEYETKTVGGSDPSAGRNLRNWWREDDLSDAWVLGPESFPGAHFATFPTEIPRRAILAGSSAHGVCSRCLAPYRRVVERGRTFESGSGRSGNMPIGKNGSRLQGGGATLDIRRGPTSVVETLGWSPTCPHADAPIVPATVLDCFSGSGTTLMVADRLGRDAIGIDLQDSYVFMSERRIAHHAPLFTTIDTLRQADFLEPDGAEG